MAQEKKKVLFITKYKSVQVMPASSLIMRDYILKQGHEVFYADPTEITTILNKGNVRMFFEGKDISNVDIVIVRKSKNVVEITDQLVKLFKSKGALVFGYEDEEPFSYRKFDDHFKFIEYYPKTICLTRNSVKQAFDLLEQAEIKLPFIIKPEGASKGTGVALISSKKEYEDYFEQEEVQEFSEFIVQEYLDVLNEYRVFVLGNESLGACEKIGEGLIAKNFAQGGKFVYLRDSALESFAERISLRIKHHILGFDIVRTKKGEFKILEINAWPSIIGFGASSGLNMPEKIFNYFLSQTKEGA